MTQVLPTSRPASPGTSADRPGRATGRRVARAVGAVLVLLGVVVLLFGAYLMWGTGLTEASHQQALRRQWAADQARAARAVAGAGRLSGVQPPSSPPPAVGRPIGTIDIPAIGVRQVVVQGTGTDQLREGPGHYPATPMPGQAGNAAIAGHRTTYGAPFYHLDALARGDAVYVTTSQGHFRYDVVRSFVVLPSDVAVLRPSPVPELTLTTCNPRYSAAERLVVQAVLAGPPVPGRAGPVSGAATTTGGGDPWVAAGWGVGWVAVTAATWLAVRRRRRRWPVALVGAVVSLAVLLACFTQLAPLLPASF